MGPTRVVYWAVPLELVRAVLSAVSMAAEKAEKLVDMRAVQWVVSWVG